MANVIDLKEYKRKKTLAVVEESFAQQVAKSSPEDICRIADAWNERVNAEGMTKELALKGIMVLPLVRIIMPLDTQVQYLLGLRMREIADFFSRNP